MTAFDTKQSASKHTYTLPPYMDPQLFQQGWQMMISTDGDIYYQNNITKKTQWTPPAVDQSENSESDISNVVPFIQMTKNVSPHDRATQISQITSSSALQQDINTEPKRIRKIWDKNHFIWIFTLVLSIYDIVTDFQVAFVWWELPSLCSQFTCYTPNQQDATLYYLALLLVLCSLLGFSIGIIIKCVEFKLLYDSYKSILTEKELNEKQHQIWKIYLKYGWIPLIAEDVVSIVLLECTYAFAMSIDTLDIVYSRSLCISFMSIVFTLINSYRKKVKLVKLKLFPNVMSCYCGWCSCLCCCFVPFVLFCLYVNISVAESIHKWAFVDIVDYSDYTSSHIYSIHFTCGSYITRTFGPSSTSTSVVDPIAFSPTTRDNDSYVGEIKHPPAFVYPNCSGYLYDYDLICRGSAKNDIKLQCILNWEYMEDNNETALNCYNYDKDMCGFHIDLGVCEDHLIECDNDWKFFDGNPLMWACFQECTL